MSKSTKQPRFTSISPGIRSGYYVNSKGLVVYEKNTELDWLYLTTVINGREYNQMIEGTKYPTPREICNLCRKFINEINP